MKTIIAGSRTITDYSLVEQAVSQADFVITEVISGHAGGVDTLGEKWARLHHLPLLIMPADWATYGKKAGYLRNEEMAKLAEAALIIWDGKSRGTKNMMELAKAYGLSLFVLRPTGVFSKA